MKSFRASIGGIFFALCMALLPRAAMAVQCNTAHTFITGEALTQNVLNANPNQFTSCFANIDYRNIGPAGIFPSQLVPQSAAQATFGGTVPYTFSLPPTMTQPLAVSSGGTGTNNGTINGLQVGYVPGGGRALPGIFTVGTNSISVESTGANPLYIGNYNTSMPSINMGVFGNWAQLSSTGFSVPTLTAAQRITIQPSQIQMVTPTQSTNYFVRGSGNIAWYDNTRARQSNVEIDMANQRLQADGVNINDTGGTIKYAVPYDARSQSNSRATHLDHGSDQVTIVVGSPVQCASYTFSPAYSILPDIIVSPNTGGLAKVYVNSRSTTGMQICANTGIPDSTTPSNPANATAATTVAYSWHILGE